MGLTDFQRRIKSRSNFIYCYVFIIYFDPTDEAIPLINGNNGIIYDCKIEIHNDREICNIYLKDKKYGILYYGISNKSCFSINHNITNINQYNI